MVAVGLTVIVAPVPSDVPEVHDPEYQFQLPPVPKLPPLIDNTDVLPKQIEEGLDEALVAEVDSVLSSTFAVTHDVFPQVPSALT